MKSTTILFYFLPILLWLIASVHSSKDFDNGDEKKFSKIADEGDEVQLQPQNLYDNIVPEYSPKSRLFFNIDNKERRLPSSELHNILYNYLSLYDLLQFQKTCKAFHNLVEPNENNLVTYVENLYWGKEKKTEVELDWFDLRFFLSNCLNDAFHPVEVFNIKRYHYTIVLRTNEIKTFPVYQTIPFLTTLLRVVPNPNNENIFSLPNVSAEEVVQIRNTKSWFSITDEGKCELQNFTLPQDRNLKEILNLATGMSAFSTIDPLGNIVVWGPFLYKFHIALFQDGRVFGLGESYVETVGRSRAQMLFSTHLQYAVLYDDGSVCMRTLVVGCMGIPDYPQELTGVKMLFSNARTFIVLFLDGHIEAHGVRKEDIPEDKKERLNGKKVIKVLPQTEGFRVFYEEGNEIREIRL